MPTLTPANRVLSLAKRTGRISREQVLAAGLHTQVLTRLVASGALERVSRGRYRLTDAPITENHGLAVVAHACPRAVVCLLSALRFHDLGTQQPHEVWIAVDRRARRPALRFPKLRVQRFSGNALTEGVESHRIEGVDVRIYGIAKTIADTFKYRNKVGLDVALEALREGWRDRRFTMEEMRHHARVCRVENVMRPYLEALVA